MAEHSYILVLFPMFLRETTILYFFKLVPKSLEEQIISWISQKFEIQKKSKLNVHISYKFCQKKL